MHQASVSTWRQELPALTACLVALREPVGDDVAALVALLSTDDASHFGIDGVISEEAVRAFVERAARDRERGSAFTYAVVSTAGRGLVGLVQVRALDPSFETAEWECTLAAAVRGSGAFLEAARLVGGFVFGSIGAHRLEARVQLQNGRANGALRKLGAVQEGILRRSLRRRGEYVDQVLWSVLREDWSDHWTPVGQRVH